MKLNPSWHQRLKSFWKRLYHSKLEKLSKGANEIRRMIRSAHKDNWRRKQK
jgi:hypothetical protein